MTYVPTPTLGNDLASAQTTIPRDLAQTSTALVSGSMQLVYFTAASSLSVVRLRTVVSSPVAGATPTLCRMGIYSIAANGDGTLVASTANDTNLWVTQGTFTEAQKALSSSFPLVPGQRYADALLIVSAAAMPALYAALPLNTTTMGATPRLSSSLAGQTDLPASFTAASLTVSNKRFYVSNSGT